MNYRPSTINGLVLFCVTEFMAHFSSASPLRTRARSGDVDYAANDAQNALKQILMERKGELVFKGLRWLDLRRLKRERAGISIVRVIDGVTYTLPPNDPRYILPIPNDVIAFTGVLQNIK